MAEIVFYHSPRSLKGKILEVILLEKKCDYEARKVNTYKMSDLKPIRSNHILVDEQLVFCHGRTVIEDFYEILSYLEEKFPLPSMIPEDDKGKAVQEKWLEYIESVPMIELLYDQTGFPIRSGFISIYERRLQKLEAASKAKPKFAAGYQKSIEGGRKVLAVLNDEEDGYSVSQKLFEFLNNMEAALLGKDYFTGSRPVLVDYVIAASLHALKTAGLAGMWQGGKFPRVSMFYSRFMKNKNFSQVCLEKEPIREDIYLAFTGLMYIINKRLHEPV